jgi:hypothetical protein
MCYFAMMTSIRVNVQTSVLTHLRLANAVPLSRLVFPSITCKGEAEHCLHLLDFVPSTRWRITALFWLDAVRDDRSAHQSPMRRRTSHTHDHYGTVVLTHGAPQQAKTLCSRERRTIAGRTEPRDRSNGWKASGLRHWVHKLKP